MMFQFFIIDIIRQSKNRELNKLTFDLIFDIYNSENINKVMKIMGME